MQSQSQAPSVISSRMTDITSEDGDEYRSEGLLAVAALHTRASGELSTRPTSSQRDTSQPDTWNTSSAARRGMVSSGASGNGRGTNVFGGPGVSMSNSSRPQSSASRMSRTSRTHVPSLTSYAFFRPMSSQRLQAQRGVRPGAPGQNSDRVVATQEIHGLNSNTTVKPDQTDHELSPPSRGTDITENDLRDRASDNASPTGGRTTRSIGESTRPLQNAPSYHRQPYHDFRAHSRQTHGVSMSNPKSNGSFRSSFLLPSRRVSQDPTGTNLHNITQEFSGIISPPSIDQGKLVQHRTDSGRNHQYFTGNTAFLWAGRIQNTREKPINIATGTLVVLPSILFFVFS